MSRYFEDCINCENRKPGCHSYCKSYKDSKKKQLEDKERIDKSNRLDREFISYYESNLKKSRNRKGRK